MRDESTKDPASVIEECSDDLFLVEVPLEPEKLPRIDALSGINLPLEAANCQPGTRMLIVNIVRASKGDISWTQLMLLDPPDPPRITCSVDVLFPKAPAQVKFTLTKRFSEFFFRPNMTVSEWIGAGRLDLQVRN